MRFKLVPSVRTRIKRPTLRLDVVLFIISKSSVWLRKFNCSAQTLKRFRGPALGRQHSTRFAECRIVAGRQRKYLNSHIRRDFLTMCTSPLCAGVIHPILFPVFPSDSRLWRFLESPTSSLEPPVHHNFTKSSRSSRRTALVPKEGPRTTTTTEDKNLSREISQPKQQGTT